ncbi:putative fungal specific transcription protein [Lasiodiplodia theobromae]|uniref:SnoaL-like domain-containing protein n=1 Tax=Lasiodiplodia theobromae TaxID=45133 RepID=A0A5N5D2D4_9PEZI|nr:hypothetical protein DBV05_g9542 [Lasiodiplodia theobromae]KAF9636772.1 putative fungal specific transcription protein [Lasiodiplodia theobromae]
MPHSYASEYPAGIDFDPAYKQFFEDFYAASDIPGQHEKYADNFTDDATLIMASKTVKGRAEIIGLRNAMWEKVSSRQHAPLKIFPAGAKGADEVMLYGTVAYTFKDGRQGSVDWAARANLVKEDGRVKMRYYQVYLDTAAQQAAK